MTVVYDVHRNEADKDFAGIVALLPQAKSQRVRSAVKRRPGTAVATRRAKSQNKAAMTDQR